MTTPIHFSEKLGAEPTFIFGSGNNRREMTRKEAAGHMHGICKKNKRKEGNKHGQSKGI